MTPKLFNTVALPELSELMRVNLPHEEVIEGAQLLDLVPENSPGLRQPTEKWDFSRPQDEARELYLNLSKTMLNNNGIGLSANQVGLNYRVFVLVSGYGFPMGFFNPVIVSTSGEEVYMDEGCLSFPQLVVKIKRPAIVRVRFAEWNGDVVTKQFEGMTARAIQHEIDHLDGLTMKDRANPVHFEKALRQRKQHLKLLKQHA